MKSVFLIFLLLVSSVFASMQYFKGTGPEMQLEEEGEVRLMTWNLLGLPSDICATSPWEERIDGMANIIRSDDPDILLLQESFMEGLSLGLFERLKDLYPHIFLHLKEDTPFPSGLAVFSKLPITDFRFIPHSNLLDSERKFKMGICAFVVLNKNKRPIGHIAASHFQGSSRCEWRKGKTDQGETLDYAEIRQAQALAALRLKASVDVPHYVCGDLNVDRRSIEIQTSLLNPSANPSLKDGMSPLQRREPTSSTYFKHLRELRNMYPKLSSEEVSSLAQTLKSLYLDEMIIYLSDYPWSLPVAEFDPSMFKDLEQKLDLSSPQRSMAWRYVIQNTIKAVDFEKTLWANNKNDGKGPPASIGEVMQVRALPFEEALDCILGTNESAMVYDVQILKGYDETDQTQTFSDHHPFTAKIRVAVETIPF